MGTCGDEAPRQFYSRSSFHKSSLSCFTFTCHTNNQTNQKIHTVNYFQINFCQAFETIWGACVTRDRSPSDCWEENSWYTSATETDSNSHTFKQKRQSFLAAGKSPGLDGLRADFYQRSQRCFRRGLMGIWEWGFPSVCPAVEEWQNPPVHKIL